MHSHNLTHWQHDHDFAVVHEHGERRTLQVLLLTALTMVVEIVVGLTSGSMALLADGWHMSTHVVAFLITIFAYRYARQHASDPTFAFGTGKVSVLGGFASAVALAVVALMMGLESAGRIIVPRPIHFNEAIGVAVLGLAVNIACAFLLQDHHAHGHDHDNGHHQHDHHHDHNLKAAYLHVLADAFTSVLAIIALLTGKYAGLSWLDPVMGLVGALVITRWSWSLLRETGPILLDGSIEEEALAIIRRKIEEKIDNRIADIHVWRIGPAHYAAIISIVTHYPQSVGYYKDLLRDTGELAHITIEVNTCDGEACLVPVDLPATGAGENEGVRY